MNVPNVDMKIDRPYLSYRNRFTGNSQSIHSFFNKDNAHLHAIAIVYKKGYSFQDLTINSRKPFLYINDDIQDMIKSNLVDFIVYGTTAPYDNCQLFINLYNDYANKDYILREFDNNKGSGKDRTLSRCALDGNSFAPEKFKLGSLTPGMENDCSGAQFFLDQFISEIATPIQQKAFDSDNFDEIDHSLEQTNAPQCTASVDSSAYQNISDDAIEEIIQHQSTIAAESTCTALNLGVNAGNIAYELDRTNKRKRRLSESVDHEKRFEWETTEHFQ